MYKNQLQELAQRSCFNLPSYACIRQGPDHAPRFKASVNFNGEIFESPSYCSTLRQAEHAAAEVALNVLSSRGPSRSLTARVLDETGIYKNLLQETAHRAGLSLPVYTTIRSGPGHVPIFTSTVELAGMNFTGEPAKTKKQAEKNAAIAAWSALKNMPNLDSLTNKEADSREEQDQAVVARVLSGFKPKDDSKQVKRRDHSQTRRRSIKNHRENTSASLPSQRWRLMDLLINAAIDGSTQKQNSFVSLLPPPPPPTTSKILPPTTPRDYRTISVKVKAKSEMKMQENNPLLDEHQRDEEEWLGGKPDVFKKPIEKEVPSSSNSSSLYGTSSVYKPFPFCNIGKLKESMSGNTTRQDATYIGSRLFGSQNPPPIRSTPHPVFNPHSRIAPAVHIRSVIPVCAAPPLRTDPPPSMKETSPSATKASLCSTSVSTQAGEEASLFSQPQKSPTQLSSELNKLQL